MAVATSERKATRLASNGLSKRDLSGYLHNSLQSELLRISKQLEVDVDTNQTSSRREHLTELSETLNRSSSEVSTIRARGIDDLQRICNAWSGLAEINLVIGQSLKPEEQHCIWVIECVQELITNSIRHGDAKNIEIRLDAHGDSVAIELSHDGKGKIVNSTGLGLRYMSSHAQVVPEITRKKGQTSIKLII
jgi:two-component sensor histidine kinase